MDEMQSYGNRSNLVELSPDNEMMAGLHLLGQRPWMCCCSILEPGTGSTVSGLRQDARWFPLRELRIHRVGNALMFRRWSIDQDTVVLWANLKFTTWEKLVLFQCSFMSLKYLERDYEGIQILEFGPELLFEERREFVGEILDGCGHAHPLLILQDEGSKEYRLEARCSDPIPAWTVFITHNLRSLDRFCQRKNEHTVELRDLESFVFTEQCPGRHGRERFVTCDLMFSSPTCMSFNPLTIISFISDPILTPTPTPKAFYRKSMSFPKLHYWRAMAPPKGP